MARHQVVISGQFFPSVDVERTLLADIGAELVVAKGDVDTVLNQCRHADAILTAAFPWDADAIAELTRCQIIACYGTGYNKIDTTAARSRGITVTNVPDYSTEEVATHALALILTLIRKIATADGHLRDGKWSIDDLRPIRRISTLSAGLVGYGRIARRLGEGLQALGMSLFVTDPYISPGSAIPPIVDLPDLMSNSDVISIHVPLTNETRGLLGAEQLSLMKECAVLINTSRGGVLEQEFLLEMLETGRLAGAALDVFDPEPPDIERLRSVPNLILTPHVAYYSEEAITESQRKAASQVAKVLKGHQPDYAVN